MPGALGATDGAANAALGPAEAGVGVGVGVAPPESWAEGIGTGVAAAIRTGAAAEGMSIATDGLGGGAAARRAVETAGAGEVTRDGCPADPAPGSALALTTRTGAAAAACRALSRSRRLSRDLRVCAAAALALLPAA